jgi:tetratricopeptide (TPR) repeat protein
MGSPKVIYMNVVRCCVVLMTVAVAPAAAADNQQTFGANHDLVAGARALQYGDFESGIRLTHLGLKSGSSPLERVKALNNLCAGYTAAGLHDQAILHCDQALSLDTRNWRIFNNRALAHLGNGRIFAAKQDLEKGLKLNPESRKLAQVAALIDAREKRFLLAAEN